MAKYRLMQDKDVVNFDITPDFKDLKNDNLKDIIKFTGVFNNSDELKEYLNKYKLIKTNKPLSIKYKFGGKDNTLRYGITYQDGLKFFDISNIIEFIEQNRNNADFLETLCNHYRSSYVNGGNILEIRNYIKVLNRQQVALDDESEIVKDFHYAINGFVKRECNRFNSNKKKYSPNFKGMRDLAMFLVYQKGKDETLTTYNMDNTNEFIEYCNNKNLQFVDESNIEEKPKIKTKNNKKDFPGQMSFIINDGNVTI